MAVSTSALTAIFPSFPAEFKIFNLFSLRQSPVTLHSSSSISSFPISFRSPSFAISFPNSFRVTAQQKYAYPDPSPEFAQVETAKFRDELTKKLTKDKDEFGDLMYDVVNLCAEIFGEFLNKDYGGPGTLVVEPFTDMLVALKERKLPGAPLAARASLLWAQNHVDQDWDIWNGKLTN